MQKDTTNSPGGLPDLLEDVQSIPASTLVPKYHVVLLDDNEHSYAYVIEMLGNIFGHSPQKAYGLAVIVDRQKRVIVDTTHKERAELKRDQIHSYGPDWRIPHCAGSMSAIIEPASRIP